MFQQLIQYLLLGVFLFTSADAKWMAEIPGAPPRRLSKLLKLPSWIVNIQDYNEDAFNATTIFSVLCVTLAMISAFFYIVYVYYPSLPRNKRSIGPFNTLIMLYLVGTFFATLTFSFLSVGRVWAAFGVFHNMFEVSLLSHLLFRQRSIMQRGFVSTLFLYVLGTMFAVIILPWPLDALFFKFQGLASDFALAINLGRLYHHNKAIHKKACVGTMISSADEDYESNDNDDDEYTQECEKLVHQLQEQYVAEQKQVDDDPKKVTLMDPVHKNISVLYTAAIAHAFGNGLVTFANHFYLWVVFQFIYGVSFPMYAYYCIIEPNASRVNFYKKNYAKEALVMVTGVALSGLCIAVGIYNAKDHHNL